MSFKNDADKVRNETLSLGLRYVCLVNCIGTYSWLTRTSFRQICLELDGRAGFRFGAENDGETLTLALQELSDARESFLRALERFARARSHAKARGRRQPSKAEIAKLFESVSLGS